MRLNRYCIMLLAALGIVAVSGSTLVAQTNLLVNPGFEDGGGSYDGWFTFGEGVQLSLPDGDNIIRTGAAAAKVYGEFTTCPGNPQFDVGGFGQLFTPTAGKIYELSGYSFISDEDLMTGTDVCASNRLIAKVVFFDAVSGGNEIQSNEIIVGNFDTPVGEWVDFTVSAPAPAGALRVEALLLFLQPACDEGAVFVDDVTFFELDPPAPTANMLTNPSFDNDLTGWVTFANAYYDGRYWARRTAPGAAKLYGAFGAPGDASGLYQQFPASEGEMYRLDVYSMTTCQQGEIPLTGSNDNYASAKIVFLDAGEAEIGFAETVIGDSSMALGTWTMHSIIGTAPEGTASVRSYLLFIQPTSMEGAIWLDDASFYDVTATADTPEPLNFELSQNVPNPFNPVTRIDFHLERADNVVLEVYDVAGRHVSTLHSGHLEAGPHSANWNGRADNGTSAASGVYWYVLKTSAGMEAKRMVLLR